MDEATVSRFMKASREGKLSTRDRRFLQSFALTPEEMLADMEDSISAFSLAELTRALEATSSPKVRNVLQETKDQFLQYATAKGQKQIAEEAARVPPTFMEHLGGLLQNLFSVPR